MLTREEHNKLSDLHNDIHNIFNIQYPDERRRKEEQARKALGSIGKSFVYAIVKRGMDHETKRRFEIYRATAVSYGRQPPTIDEYLENFTCKIDDHYGKPLQHIIIAIQDSAEQILHRLKNI